MIKRVLTDKILSLLGGNKAITIMGARMCVANIKAFFYTFLLWIIVGVITKVMFCLMYLGDYSVADWMQVMWHGLRLDISIAGYLTLVAGLLLIVRIWWRGKGLRWIWHVWSGIAALVCSLGYVSNLVLYGYWRFPLDNTPLLYIRCPLQIVCSTRHWYSWPSIGLHLHLL